jgi:hypothetical protein
MTILPPWMRSLGAAGAASNAAAVCERRRLEEQAVEARLQAFHESEHARRMAASPARSARTIRAA